MEFPLFRRLAGVEPNNWSPGVAQQVIGGLDYDVLKKLLIAFSGK